MKKLEVCFKVHEYETHPTILGNETVHAVLPQSCKSRACAGYALKAPGFGSRLWICLALLNRLWDLSILLDQAGARTVHPLCERFRDHVETSRAEIEPSTDIRTIPIHLPLLPDPDGTIDRRGRALGKELNRETLSSAGLGSKSDRWEGACFSS